MFILAKMHEDIVNMTPTALDIKWMQSTLMLAQHSQDPSTQNAAKIVDSSRQILLSEAVNELVGDVLDSRWQRPLKYQYVEHSERSAIYDAAKNGTALSDGVVYVPFSPCVECARAIIVSGVKHVITHAEISKIIPEHWKESLEVASGLLAECGVELQSMQFPNFDIAIRFNGESITL